MIGAKGIVLIFRPPKIYGSFFPLELTNRFINRPHGAAAWDIKAG